MDKQNIFNNYLDYLYTSTGRQYERIDRYIRIVKLFMDSGLPLSKAGYKRYMHDNSIRVINEPLTKEALCDFLDFMGIGFKRRKTNKEVKTLEKLSVISEKNMGLLNDFIYYLTQEEDYSPNTLQLYAYSVKKYFEYANEISVDNYKRFVNTMEEEGFSPKTIRLRITALERLSKYVNKPINLKRPKFKRELATNNVPTEADYAKLLDYLKTKPDLKYYFFVRILATTGARLSEFLQFKWEDIINGEMILKGKGNKYRKIFFNKQLQNEVKAYLNQYNKTGYVAVGRFGRITSRGINSLMKDWGAKCGIENEKMHPHAFRHFFMRGEHSEYSKIIANPPFSNNQDIDHVRMMYVLLKKGGTLASITSAHWELSNEKKCTDFREWLSSVQGEVLEIQQGEFKSSGTSIETRVIIIRKNVL